MSKIEVSRKQYPKQILVRLTEAEKQLIDNQAAQAGISVSRFLVHSAVGNQAAIDPKERELRERMLFELRKVGVNLNQIAYAINAARRSGGSDGEPSAAELREIAEELKAVLEFVKGTL